MSKIQERCERFILFSTLTFIYCAPLFCYILPASENKITAFIGFHILFSMLSVLYALLCLCYRGFIDLMPESINPLTNYSARGCTICMQFKPERAHHCSRCKRCIKKMDHHCHWLGRCINYDNLGHFSRFLLFTLLSTFMLFTYNVFYIYNKIKYDIGDVSKTNLAVAVISSLICGLLVAITTMHFISQINMILRNITFIEMMKKRNIGISPNKYLDSMYDLGWYNNLVDVFGSPFLLFLGMPSGDGINYKKRHDDNYINNTVNYDTDVFVDV